MLPCDPASAGMSVPATDVGFITRWNKIKQSKEIQLYGRLHSDICNVSEFLLPGANLHIKLKTVLVST